MLPYLVRRLLLIPLSLVGISLVTFLLMELAPSDRAEIEVAQLAGRGELPDGAARDRMLAELRRRYGILDAETGAPRPVWSRYGVWLLDAARLRLHGPGEDPRAFRARIRGALPVSLLLGLCALAVAAGIGVPLGVWLGLRAGGNADRAVAGALFVAVGVPEFLAATLLLLWFGAAGLDLFPGAGLASPAASGWSLGRRFLDLLWHLVLPVAAMALLPTAAIARFLRESVSRAAAASFATTLRAWGTEGRVLRRRLLHNGMAPLATLLGGLLPLLVGGSVVVESVFSLQGLGRLVWRAVLDQDQGMVMALVLLASVITLGGLVLSDLLHRWVDPRVRLQR